MKVLGFLVKVGVVYAELLATPFRIVCNELRAMGFGFKNPDPWSWEDDYDAGKFCRCENCDRRA